jgi:hypothetical protein
VRRSASQRRAEFFPNDTLIMWLRIRKAYARSPSWLGFVGEDMRCHVGNIHAATVVHDRVWSDHGSVSMTRSRHLSSTVA